MLVFPPFRIDLDEERLWKGDKQLSLRRKPFAILRYLVSNPRKLVTHEELLAKVWGGAAVSESAVRSHLHELRQVLGEGVIETVIGRGYRFMTELSTELAAPAIQLARPIDPLVVGRDAEIAVLRAALERASSGHRQVCFVTGEPGIGKSTLVAAFLAGLDPRTVIVGRGHCFEQHGTAEAYLAVIEALGALTRGAQTLATLVRYAPTFLSKVPHLISDEQLAEVTRRAGGGSEAKLVREISEALEAMSAQEPVVIVLEDLQWSDVATIDLLSLLGQRQERAKLLVIGTSRHAEIQSADHPLNRVMRSLVARSGAVTVQVPKMSVATVQAFIDRRFVGHAYPQRLTDMVAKITGGTPLFMVALLDDLVGRGMLAEREGIWSLTVTIDEIEAHRPDSVKQLIDMQLDRLTVPEQRVLEAASVVGAVFSTALVAAALELPPEDVDDLCDALMRRSQFLRAEPAEHYAVTHTLVQEVCADRSSPARRQRWHRLVAEAIERDSPSGQVPHLLAKHYDGAGDAARAIPAYLAAGHHTAQRFASADAFALCERALDLLPRLPGGRDRDLLELQILGTIGQMVTVSSTDRPGHDPLAVHTRAIEIARTLGDASTLYATLCHVCLHFMIDARYDRAVDFTAELAQIELTHILHPALLQYGFTARATIAFHRGDLAEAVRLFETMAPAEPSGSGPIHQSALHRADAGTAVAKGYLAGVYWLLGDPERALAAASAAISIAVNIDNPTALGLALVTRLRLHYLCRDPSALVDAAVQETLPAATGNRWLLDEARTLALWAEARHAPLALGVIQPLIDSLRRRLVRFSSGATLVGQALIEALQLSGHSAEARVVTDEVIAFAIERNESAYLPELLRLRGEQVEATDSAAAARDYREAIELARVSGARSLELRATENLARLPA